MVRSLIQALGGPAVVAKWVSKRGRKIDGDTVTAWGLPGRGIPWRWRATIREMAEAQNLELTAQWEMELALTPSDRKERAAS